MGWRNIFKNNQTPPSTKAMVYFISYRICDEKEQNGFSISNIYFNVYR